MVDLDRSQQEIQKAARDFAKGEFDRDVALEMESGGIFPDGIWVKAGDLGFLGLHFPDKYGGGGLGFLEAAIVAEAFCRQDATIGCALLLAGLGAECLLDCQDDALKQRYLCAVAEGRLRCAVALSEPGVGPAYASIQAAARLDGGHWVLNGTKTHVINGTGAGVFVVLCRTGTEQISMIAVERECDGITLQDQGRRLGANMTGSAEMRLVDVRVPVENLLGKAGTGLQHLERFLADASILLAAAATGMAAGAFDRALSYIKEREAFGRKIGAFEITRHKIAEMAAKVETARAITYRAARQHDAGKAGAVPAMAKMVATRAAVSVADEAIQIYGGYGYMKESEVERFYRDAKTIELMLGGPGEAKKKIADGVIGRKM